MINPRRPNFASTPASNSRPRHPFAPASLADAAASPVVTVVTPFFDTGAVFHETARCVLAQSLQRFEWLIVNDGTTDPEARAILDEYRSLSRRDPRVRVIDHPRNFGLPATRNTGFRSARAPLIFMLDSDDLIEPTTLEKCALFMECNPSFGFVKGKTVGFGGLEYVWEGGFHDGQAMLDRNSVTVTAMVRASVFRQIGGFDETIRGGLEDREFWVRAAAGGHWGATLPEYFDWYRRRHGMEAINFWPNLASKERAENLTASLRRRHPRLFAGEFPSPSGTGHTSHALIPERIPWSNPLAPPAGAGKRLLMIVPWLRLGGADKFNLDGAAAMTDAGWQVTIATTLPGHPWLPEFTHITPDVFMLDHLGPMPDYPRLLRHLIDSRRPDVVMVTNSQVGYFSLPFLRTHCPGPAYVDLNHMEEPLWKDGGHPRQGAGMQGQLDLSITISEHLKTWMTARGADGSRIEVCHLNADTDRLRPDPALRARKRRELGIDDGTVALLYPARLTPQKQPMVFADIARRLAARRPLGSPRLIALVAGDGELRPQLEGYINHHRLREHVRLLGSVPVGEMPALYNAADILCLPSLHEGIALTLYEGMAAGLPVVGARVGGQDELVVEGTGFLLDLQDDKAAEAREYTRVIRALVADHNLRRRTGEAARAHVVSRHAKSSLPARLQEVLAIAMHHRRTRPIPGLPANVAREQALYGIDWLRVCDMVNDLEARYARADRAIAESRHHRHQRRAAAELALAHIESSRTWKLVQALKNTGLYRLFARARYGRDWRGVLEVRREPTDHLEHIRRSRTYKLLSKMKRLPPVVIVSRARHGRDYRSGIPDMIRND